MGMRELEQSIIVEAREVSGNTKLKIKDMMEWSTGEIKPHEGEIVLACPRNGVNVAIKLDKYIAPKENI